MDKNKNLHFAIIDLEKAFDKVRHKVLWCIMHVVGATEWIVVIVQAMYNGAKSKARVNGLYSDVFELNLVGIKAVLSPLVFIIVFEALSR